jgi:hypothetical protein
MTVCITSIIMGALTITIFLNDIWRDNTDNILTHVFLGLVTTMLFYGLCGYGYEMINWICLAVIAIMLLISGIVAYNKNGCNECKEPVNRCCCKKPSCKPKPKPKCKVSKYE